MSRFAILLVLFNLLVLPGIHAQTIDKKVEKARTEATKLAASNEKAEVTMKIGDKLKGRISSVNQNSFDFIAEKSTQSKTIAFSDVEKIRKYSRVTKGSWIAIGVIGAASVVVLVLATAICRNEGNCF